MYSECSDEETATKYYVEIENERMSLTYNGMLLSDPPILVFNNKYGDLSIPFNCEVFQPSTYYRFNTIVCSSVF